MTEKQKLFEPQWHPPAERDDSGRFQGQRIHLCQEVTAVLKALLIILMAHADGS